MFEIAGGIILAVVGLAILYVVLYAVALYIIPYLGKCAKGSFSSLWENVENLGKVEGAARSSCAQFSYMVRRRQFSHLALAYYPTQALTNRERGGEIRTLPGGWPTLSFWKSYSPSKVGAPSFAATPGPPASGLGSLGWETGVPGERSWLAGVVER